MILASIGLAFFAFVGAYVWIAIQMRHSDAVIADSGGVRVADRDGNLITESFGSGEQRIPVTLDQVAPDLINATIATEDASFWHNSGVNIERQATPLTTLPDGAR